MKPASGQKRDSTLLAYERTLVASERTLMAWMRTAVSLIGFGFSISRLFGYLREMGAEHAPTPSASRRVGLVLIALGVIGILSGIHRHVRLIRGLAPVERRSDAVSMVVVAAMGLALIGIYAFLSIIPFR
jgi:putative membrane protein